MHTLFCFLCPSCCQIFGGEDTEGAELSMKQIQKKLKSDASKLAKQAAKDNKKAEADRKKAARTVTKKVIATASKMVSPLSSALHKAADVYQKALTANAGDLDETKEFHKKNGRNRDVQDSCDKGAELLLQESSC